MYQPPRAPTLEETLARHRQTAAMPVPMADAVRGERPAGYSPQRESMFASILAQGSAPSGPMGSNWEGIGKLAQVLSGSAGLHREGQARREEERLAEEARQAQEQRSRARRENVLAGLLSGGAQSPTPAALAENPDLLGPVLASRKPAEDPLDVQRAPTAMYGPDGSQVPASTWRETRELMGQGFTASPPEEPPEAPRPRMVTQNGISYWAEGPNAGEPVIDSPVAPQAAAGVAGPEAGLPANYGDESKFRDKFDRESKEFQAIQDSYRNALGLAGQRTPHGDHSLIFNYMKALDPGSVVREGEFETAQAIGGLWERAGAKLEEWTGGGMLTPEQRRGLLDAMKVAYGNSLESQRELREHYAGNAAAYGLDAGRSMRDYIIPGLLEQEYPDLGTGVLEAATESARERAGDYPAFNIRGAAEAYGVRPASPGAPAPDEPTGFEEMTETDEDEALDQLYDRIDPDSPNYDPELAAEVGNVEPVPVPPRDRPGVFGEIYDKTRERLGI